MVAQPRRYEVVKDRGRRGPWPSRRRLPLGMPLELVRAFEAHDNRGCIDPIRCTVAVLRPVCTASEDTFEVSGGRHDLFGARCLTAAGR
jgi:hypothetical protein